MADTWQAILALADTLEPAVRAEFLAAAAAVRSQVNVDTLARAIRDGKGLPELLVDLQALDESLQQQVGLVHDTVQRAGALAAVQLAGQIETRIRFDITNPEAVRQAQQLGAALVTNISTETRLALRSLLSRAFTEGLTADQTARLIRPLIGLNDGQALAAFNYRQALVEAGDLTGNRIDLLVERYAAKLLRQRADTIARTEIMTALNAGQHQMWLQAHAAGVLPSDVERQWIVTPDDKLCPRCLSLKGQRRDLFTAFVCPLDGTSVMYPPLHQRCRCTPALVIGAFTGRAR